MAKNSPTDDQNIPTGFSNVIAHSANTDSAPAEQTDPAPSNWMNLMASTSSGETRWFMPLVDILLAFAAFGLAYYVRYDLQILRPVFEQNFVNFDPYVPYMVIYAIWLYIIFRGAGLYKPVRGRPWMDEVWVIVNGTTNSTLIIMAISFFLQPEAFSRLMLIYVAAITVLLLSIMRIVQRSLRAYLRSRGIGVQRVLIVGAGDTGQAVLRTMIARKEMGYYPVGYVDDNPKLASVDLGRVKGLGGLDSLREVIRKHRVNLVIITLDWTQRERLNSLIQIVKRTKVDVRVVPDVFQMNFKQVQVENLDGIPLFGVKTTEPFLGTSRFFKRALDLGIVLLGAPLWVPVLLIVALFIRLDSNGPVFYAQRRVGENGRPFDMIKFRSMIPDAHQYRNELVETHELDPRHPKIVDDWRITRMGRFIRRASIDELPNLINVIRGEMSLVGPRPPTPDEVELYDDWHKQRLRIIPGITGLWQISGRSDVPFDEMCLLDIYYIENWSVKLDVQILLMTVPRVLLRQGAY